MEIISKNVKKVFRIKKGLFKSNKIEVVKNFDYKIKQGEIIALMGMANSGKSTIVKLLSGVEEPSSGKIYVDGEIDYKKIRNNSLMINDLHSERLLLNDSVYNNLVYFGNKLKLNDLDVEKKIIELRDVLEFEKVINKKINELNDLEKIKVNLAINMLKSPAIVFFDNALMGLDSIIKNALLKLLKRINKEFKTTIVIASVDLMDIEKICKRVSVVQNGEIIVDGDFEDVKNKYWKDKIVSVTFNKSFNIPKGEFQIIENSDYFLKIKIDFSRFDFGMLINQFDVNSIVDINISSVPIVNL